MIKENDFKYLPLEKATIPTASTVMVFKDYYWSVHPQRGLLFYWRNGRRCSSPQCNTSRVIAERICPDFAEVRFFPLVLVPIHLYGDFDYEV